jgi:hypothetical protein
MWLHLAVFNKAKAYKGAGQFAQAQNTAKELIADAPDFARKMRLDMQIRQWPKE